MSSQTHTEAPPAVEALGDHPCVGCAQPTSEVRCDGCGAAQRAGAFTIAKVLHQNARGRLYLAHGSDGQPVALKELVFATVPDVETIEAFEREGKVLRQLQHERIPRFLASFQSGQGVHTRLYLAQSFVEGSTLLQRLEAHRFSEAEVKAIAEQVLEVLAFLHGLSPRVLHRDLKPANLIQRPDGSIALVDFGAARDLGGAQTHGSTLVGTFGYMPPEQLGGTVSPSSDLYALGATLVHLLSQRPPAELLTGGLEIDFHKAVNVSPAFAAYLARLTAREPAARYHSVAEALAGLHAPAAPSRQRPEIEPRADRQRTVEFELASLQLEGRIDQTLAAAKRVGRAWSAVVATGLMAATAIGLRHFDVPLLLMFLVPTGIMPFAMGAAIARTVAHQRISRSLEAWVDETGFRGSEHLTLLLQARRTLSERIAAETERRRLGRRR